MLFSVIVPVYNRPDELGELLESLCSQTLNTFEVLVIDDGSEQRAKSVADSFRDRLDIRYYYKENSGQGFSRNFGFKRAKGDYLVVFDSDCIIPPHYFHTVRERLAAEPADAWGGPDRARDDFTPVQKAISYVMTSPFSTGGIRGHRHHYGTFHPRSFNMGISKEVFDATGGYRITRMGEDLEFSIRIIKQGFKVILIDKAWVYHKRRTDFRQFWRQLHFFGRARINLSKYHRGEIKSIHLLPALFVLVLCLIPLLAAAGSTYILLIVIPLLAGILLIFTDASIKFRSLRVGFLSVAALFVQITAYGVGFISESVRGSGSK